MCNRPGPVMRQYCPFILLFLPITASWTMADEPLSRGEIAKRVKPSVAFVEVRAPSGPATGTAFCVHPTGYFITNEHVVANQAAGEAVKLVLDAALKSEKVHSATVVRRDKSLDLALLKIET